MGTTVRGIEHIGLTVPDIEEATIFFQQAFDAKVAYDSKTPQEDVVGGKEIETILGLKKGAKIVHMRMISIGKSISIELFQYQDVDQHLPSNPDDFGIQHLAVYVDDIENAVKDFEQAGGRLNTAPTVMLNEIEGHHENNQFIYGVTPWGTVIELITYPHGIAYPSDSEASRFTPPKSE